MDNMLHENRTIIKDVMRAQGQALADVHELSFKLLKGTFNRGEFVLVAKFGVPAIQAEMAAEFAARVAPMLGFPENIVGTEYTADGVTYVVTGINPKLNSKCMRVRRTTGDTDQKLCTTPRRIREALGLPDPAAESADMEEDGDPND